MIRLTLPIAAAIAVIAAAPVNWAARITEAANGAMVIGNPAARVKIVEYMSYTCSHCADFTNAAAVPLKKNYVARGQTSFELRNAVRDRYDFAAALVARCGGPARFFGNTEMILAAQPGWLAKVSAFDAANAQALTDKPMNESLIMIADGTGLTAMMAKRGLTATQVRACLTNPAAQNKIGAMTRDAWETRKIAGTPAFFINNVSATGTTWAAIEPQIKAALAR